MPTSLAEDLLKECVFYILEHYTLDRRKDLRSSSARASVDARGPSIFVLAHQRVRGGAAGIRFTPARFIAQLAFVDEQLLAAAKLRV